MEIAYRRGLHELGDGLFAYLQPDATWGWSNAGLVTADGTSLLVDTLFDLRLTREMLDAMRPVTDGRPIDFGPFEFEGVELRLPTTTFEGRLDLRVGDRDVHLVEPGPAHTDASGVRDVMRYLTYVRDAARARFDAGMDAEEAADDIDLIDFAGWGDPERIAVNAETMYNELDPEREPASRPELFMAMARWADRH